MKCIIFIFYYNIQTLRDVQRMADIIENEITHDAPKMIPLSKEIIRKEFLAFFQSSNIIKKVIVNHINNRVQEFPDPITSTLIAMVNSPMQVTFCESGILIFKTSNLPVLPYDILSNEDRKKISELLIGMDNSLLSETYHGCGKFSVQISMGSGHYMPKQAVLSAFVDVMLNQKELNDRRIQQRLTDIILQRFLSNVSVHSDDINVIMRKIWDTE
jgi:hypothetical protein